MNLVSKLILAMLRFYQLAVSPLLGANCRFTPSCSCYAKEAIVKHGAAKGILLTTKRLLRCHPFSTAGYDPVPTHCNHKAQNL